MWSGSSKSEYSSYTNLTRDNSSANAAVLEYLLVKLAREA